MLGYLKMKNNMEIETITVDELLDQLREFDRDKKVYVYAVGVNSKMSWKAPLEFGDITVQEHGGEIHINFSIV